MTLQEIKTLVDYISNKSLYGNTMSENEYNNVLEIVNVKFFKNKLEEFKLKVANGLNEDMLSINMLNEFKSISFPTISGGEFSIPADYQYFISLYGTYNGEKKKVRLIDEDEFSNYFGNIMASNLTHTPVVVLRSNFYVVPNDITNLQFAYYKLPAQPIYDYYIDVNGNTVYLTAGATHVWVTGEIDSSGTRHTTGDSNYSSTTVELEYNQDLHWEFTLAILEFLGVKLSREDLFQYSKAIQTEEKQI